MKDLFKEIAYILLIMAIVILIHNLFGGIAVVLFGL